MLLGASLFALVVLLRAARTITGIDDRRATALVGVTTP